MQKAEQPTPPDLGEQTTRSRRQCKPGPVHDVCVVCCMLRCLALPCLLCVLWLWLVFPVCCIALE